MSVAVLVIVAAGCGKLLFRGGFFSGADGFVFRVFAGFSVCSVILLVAGSLSLGLSQLMIFLAAAVWLAYEIFGGSEGRSRVGAPDAAGPFTLLEWISVLAVAGSMSFALAGAFAPVTGWDAAVAHAALPADYAREGRITVVGGNEYSGYPHLMHVLFAQAYYGGGEPALGLLNWFFALMACGGAYALGKQAQGRACGLISAAILATAPVFIDQAGAPSVDLAFTGYTLAALAAFAAWRAGGRRELLVLAALLGGASCGVRHTGYVVCALLGAGVLFYGRGERFKSAALFCAVALFFASPWLIRSMLITGSPFYPFFAAGFVEAGMPHRDITALAAHESIKMVGLRDFLMFPWNIVMRPDMFDGWSKSPGGLVLILGIPGFFAGGRTARRLGFFSAAGICAFYFFQRLARYMLPFFAPMMVVGAAGVVRMRGLRLVTGPALAAVFIFGLGLAAGANHFKINAALGLESRQDYLQRRVERYAAFEWVNENVPRDELVLTLDRRTYYFAGPTWQNDEPLRLLASAGAEERMEWLRAHDVRWIFAPVTLVEDSPGMRGLFGPLIREWRSDSERFRLAKRLHLPRPRGGGREIVEIYEVSYD